VYYFGLKKIEDSRSFNSVLYITMDSRNSYILIG